MEWTGMMLQEEQVGMKDKSAKDSQKRGRRIRRIRGKQRGQDIRLIFRSWT
jgi:hypothetical protein